ncbi:TonB-dependent receptor [Bacteroidota bacterium]|nr:TonB-dependent receptor [Bacteroidota bacterium]
MNFNFFYFIFLLSFYLHSQTNGVLLNLDKVPIKNASVYIADQDIISYTNEFGEFTFSTKIPKNSIIEFKKYGYSTKVVNYKGGELKVYLEKLHVELDEVGIIDKSQKLGEGKTLSIETKSLNNNFISSSSLVQTITKLPGINTIGSGLGIQKIVIRGLSGLRVVSYLNGMKVNNQQWANDHGIGFTDLGLSEVELIKGASSLMYGGEAVGGLVFFKDSPFIESKIPSGYIATKFDNSHFLFGNQFGFKWSINNFFINLYGQYDLAADYRLPNNTYLFNSRFRNKGIKFSIAKRTDNTQSIFRYQNNVDEVGIPAHAHGDLSEIDINDLASSELILPDDFEATRPTQFINNHLFTLENIIFNNQSKYTFFIGHFINHLQEFEKWTVPGFDIKTNNSIGRFNYKKFYNNFTFNAGTSFEYLDNKNSEATDTLTPNASSKDIGFYSILDFENKGVGFNIGVRFDHKNVESSDVNFENSYTSFSSSAGFFIEKNDHISRLTYSSSFRSPHFSELFSYGLHHGTMRFEIGNLNLENEKSHQFDFKHQWSSQHFAFVVNPFFQYIHNFISINPTSEFYNNTYRIYNYEQFKDVVLYGFEANIHYHPHILHNLHFHQSYSFLNARNLDQDTYLTLTPANKIKTSVNFDVKQYKFLKMSNISLYHMFVFNQDNVSLYESPSDSYNLLNFELVFNPLKNMTIVSGIKNVLNVEYVPHLSRIKEVGSGVPEPGRSFNVSVKYDF